MSYKNQETNQLLSIANKIIDTYYHETNGKYIIPPLHLQKCLWFMYLENQENPKFKELFEYDDKDTYFFYWLNGPVIPEIYFQFKYLLFSPYFAEQVMERNISKNTKHYNISPEIIESIEKITKKIVKLDTQNLSNISHEGVHNYNELLNKPIKITEAKQYRQIQLDKIK